MRNSLNTRPGLPVQPWFLVLLAAYAVLEISFNHRLLELPQSWHLGVTAGQAQAMEHWARVVSGLGLGLLLMRALYRRIPSRWWLVFTCFATGLLVMWHAQKALVDAIVASADEKDLQISVLAQLSTAEALKGRIELRGQPVLEAPARQDMRAVMSALWPSSVLALSPDDLEMTSGALQLTGAWLYTTPSPDQARVAYRNAVMMPVALGASLFFGLLNLCQLFSGVVVWALSLRQTLLRWAWLERWVLPVLVATTFGMSWLPGNAWVDSPAYRQVARPALWQDKALLAPFVEWSLRAELAWSDPVAWVHRELLQGFDFRDLL